MNEDCNSSEQESRRLETFLLRGIKSFENGTAFPLVSEGADGPFFLSLRVLKFLLVITAILWYYFNFCEMTYFLLTLS